MAENVKQTPAYCAICKRIVLKFRDIKCETEFKQSNMCQECQDEFFERKHFLKTEDYSLYCGDVIPSDEIE